MLWSRTPGGWQLIVILGAGRSAASVLYCPSMRIVGSGKHQEIARLIHVLITAGLTNEVLMKPMTIMELVEASGHI